jgi:hypothetical protein
MPIRHDLQKLYDLATERGYKSFDPRIPEVVGWLEPHHFDFSFRYKEKTGPRTYPDPKELGEVVKILCRQIEPVTRAAFLKTQQK